MSDHTDLNLSHYEEIASPHELKQKYPLTKEQARFISDSRQTIQNILSFKDPRLIVIAGPCSIHDTTSAKEYAVKLQALANEISDQIYVIMRVYLEKPRTSLGWKGLLYDPYLNNSNDMHTGLCASREFLLELASLQIPAAAEFLDLSTMYYLNDLISWGCIGARTTSSQFHRQVASGLPMPIGFKNNTDGNINIAIDGIEVASHPHTFIGMNSQGQATLLHTKGNSNCHLVLRGGHNTTNFDPASISDAMDLLEEAHLKQTLLIDCSHGNAMKQHLRQIDVFQSVVKQYLEGNKGIRGLLLESYLFSGKQRFEEPLKYGISVTDACLDWETTQSLIQWAYERCKKDIFALRS